MVNDRPPLIEPPKDFQTGSGPKMGQPVPPPPVEIRGGPLAGR